MKPLEVALLAVLAVLACLLTTGQGLEADEPPHQETAKAGLDKHHFGAWRDLIRTRDAELAWQQLPWSASFHQGMERAAREEKPLLLWVMNGHPMGCT